MLLKYPQNLNLDTAVLRHKLGRPLRPEWITQASSTPFPKHDSEYHRVICCTASRQEGISNVVADSYIQGAGDDSEGWSRGLTPSLFWQNSITLLSASFDEEEVIATFLQKNGTQAPQLSSITPIYPANAKWPIHICKVDDLDNSTMTDFDCIITSDYALPIPTAQSSKDESRPLVLHLDCKTGKLGSRSLRDQLPRITPFITKVATRGDHPQILFVCATGRDLSVGVALAVLCLYFDEDGKASLSSQLHTY